MDVRTQTQNTPAELALIGAFDERLSELPGDGNVMLKRDAAIEAIKAGLPTRRVEAWHYTDLRRLLAKVPAYDENVRAEHLRPLLEGAFELAVLDGVAGPTPALEGVSLPPIGG